MHVRSYLHPIWLEFDQNSESLTKQVLIFHYGGCRDTHLTLNFDTFVSKWRVKCWEILK